MAASQTRTRVSSCKPISTKELYAIDYGVPRKSVAIVWQKDLFRFLPKGQGDSKCQHVYNSLFSYVCRHIVPYFCFKQKILPLNSAGSPITLVALWGAHTTPSLYTMYISYFR